MTLRDTSVHAGDYLNAIPVSSGMRVKSLVWEQTTQRRLGLYITGAPESDPFGDLIINNSAHGHRHFLVNAAWARALYRMPDGALCKVC